MAATTADADVAAAAGDSVRLAPTKFHEIWPEVYRHLDVKDQEVTSVFLINPCPEWAPTQDMLTFVSNMEISSELSNETNGPVPLIPPLCSVTYEAPDGCKYCSNPNMMGIWGELPKNRASSTYTAFAVNMLPLVGREAFECELGNLAACAVRTNKPLKVTVVWPAMKQLGPDGVTRVNVPYTICFARYLLAFRPATLLPNPNLATTEIQ
jgi:hypothetical protein